MNLESFVVESAGRLDKILTDVLGESRNQVEQLIKEGLVLVNGKTILKTGKKLSFGDKVEYKFKEVVPKIAPVIDFDVEIIYEDDDGR